MGLSKEHHCFLGKDVASFTGVFNDFQTEMICKSTVAPDNLGMLVTTSYGKEWITVANEPCCCESGPAHAMSAGACWGRYSSRSKNADGSDVRLQWCHPFHKRLKPCKGDAASDWREFVRQCAADLAGYFYLGTFEDAQLRRVGECLHALQDFPNHTQRYSNANGQPSPSFITINEHHRTFTENDNSPNATLTEAAHCLGRQLVTQSLELAGMPTPPRPDCDGIAGKDPFPPLPAETVSAIASVVR